MIRLLVVRFGALGDLIHMSPALQAVKAAQPETEIHLLTSPLYRGLAQMLPGIDHVWTWQKKDGWRALWRLSQTLRKTGIDCIANLHPSFKTWLLTQGVGPKQSAIYHKEKLRAKGSAQRALPRHHAMKDFYQPFRKLFPLPETLPYRPILMLDATQTTQLEINKPDTERWIGLIPGVGAKRSNRAWLPESYVELILSCLQQPNYRILLFGGPDEQALSEWLIQQVRTATGQVDLEKAVPQKALYKETTASGAETSSQESHSTLSKAQIDGSETYSACSEADFSRLENHCGKHDIPGTAQWMAQCDVILGGDTGPLHLAAGTSVPVVGIFGPTSLSRTGPVGLGDIEGLSPPASLECWPCEQPECPLSGEAHLACMREIPVITVKQVLNTQLHP